MEVREDIVEVRSEESWNGGVDWSNAGRRESRRSVSHSEVSNWRLGVGCIGVGVQGKYESRVRFTRAVGNTLWKLKIRSSSHCQQAKDWLLELENFVRQI